jgi:hypothetical protein
MSIVDTIVINDQAIDVIGNSLEMSKNVNMYMIIDDTIEFMETNNLLSNEDMALFVDKVNKVKAKININKIK